MRYPRINNQKMKSINKQTVLNSIRKSGAISRKDLAKKTKLTTGTITNLTDELIKSGLILEVGNGESEGGRKPILLELNPRAGYAIGLELNTSQVIGVLSNFQGKIIDKTYISIDIEKGKDVVIDEMVSCIENIIVDNSIEYDWVIGIGLAVPGPFDDKNGTIINPPNLKGWLNVPIRDIIQERTGIKTYVEKETQASILCEYWFGDCDSYKRIFQVNVYNIGIGGGFLEDGKLYHGVGTSGMELGHTTIKIDGRPCICGNRGCLEAHANGISAVRYVKELLADGQESALAGRETVTLDDVTLAAKQGDAVCVQAIEKCANYLSVALLNMIGVLSPDAIIFGGDFIDRSELLYEKVLEYMKDPPYFLKANEVRKMRASFGIDAGAIGGIAIVLNAISEI